ncbi:hypothetical protein MMC13_001728 [Lambiella insularis]|nr:hypothetical protein [Lambiella insularis]
MSFISILVRSNLGHEYILLDPYTTNTVKLTHAIEEIFAEGNSNHSARGDLRLRTIRMKWGLGRDIQDTVVYDTVVYGENLNAVLVSLKGKAPKGYISVDFQPHYSTASEAIQAANTELEQVVSG